MKVRLPASSCINRRLSKNENFRDLVSISKLDEKIGGKIYTCEQLHGIVSKAIQDWGNYHSNSMILMFAEQTIPIIVNTMFKNDSAYLKNYCAFLEQYKKKNEVNGYFV